MNQLLQLVLSIARSKSMFPIMVVLIAALIGMTAAYVTKVNNGPVEQLAEKVIKAETGLDIDLTPESVKEENAKGGVESQGISSGSQSDKSSSNKVAEEQLK